MGWVEHDFNGQTWQIWEEPFRPYVHPRHPYVIEDAADWQMRSYNDTRFFQERWGILDRPASVDPVRVDLSRWHERGRADHPEAVVSRGEVIEPTERDIATWKPAPLVEFEQIPLPTDWPSGAWPLRLYEPYLKDLPDQDPGVDRDV